MKNKLFALVALLTVLSVFAAACGAAATPVPPTAIPPTPVPPTDTPIPEPTAIPWTAPEGALISVKADAAPTLDGVADDAAWKDAPVLAIEVSGGANMGATTVNIQSVYTADMVYFVATYSDPTESIQRAPWVMQEDGTWLKLKDPEDKGGDNNLYYEDKFSMIWPIGDSVPKFEQLGCFTGCHANDGTGKPYGNKYFEDPNAIADMWHWKSIRNLNQIDDQYVDATAYDKDKAPNAGRKTDPKPDGSGGYVDNQTEDKKLPAFSLPGNIAAPPYFILDSEKVPFDPAAYKPGDEVPGIIVSEFTGDRGDIAAGWKYADGAWTLEFSRKLVTASEKYDVQFTDLTATYWFGVSVFDNAQVRHAYEAGSTPFVFKP